MKITINKKQSNSGTIHDIASEHYDIEINMTGYKYALVLASYYGGKNVFRTKSDSGLIKLMKENKEYSFQILDANGENVTEAAERLLYS